MVQLQSNEGKKFSEEVGKILRDQGILQAELASVSGLKDSQVSDMIRGEGTRLTRGPVLKCLKGLIILHTITTRDEIEDLLLYFFNEKRKRFLHIEELGPQGRELLTLIDKAQTDRQKALEKPKYTSAQGRPIIGRDEVIEDIYAKLQGDTRFLTLTGLPGAGKTALAQQILQLAQPQEYFTYVLPMLLLEGSYDIDEVLRKIRELLPKDTHARILLVLDNCEQIQDMMRARDKIYNRLFVEYPKLTILATSQTQFSESNYPVEMLDRPRTRDEPLERLQAYPAVKLLLEYTKRYVVDKPFQVTDKNKEVVAALCIALDGLPLALKIAGPLIKPYGITAVYDMVLDRQIWKVKDTLPLSERQQTLLNLFEASYHLLDKREQRLFRRLGAFPSKYSFFDGFNIHAAAVICSLDDLPADERHPDFINALNILVTHNLIAVTNGQIKMAHNTIRDFARSKLDDDPEATEGERMREQYIDYGYSLAFQSYTTEVYIKEKFEELARAEGFLEREFEGYSSWSLDLYDLIGKYASTIVSVHVSQTLSEELLSMIDSQETILEISNIEVEDMYNALRYFTYEHRTDTVKGRDILELFDVVLRQEWKAIRQDTERRFLASLPVNEERKKEYFNDPRLRGVWERWDIDELHSWTFS